MKCSTTVVDFRLPRSPATKNLNMHPSISRSYVIPAIFLNPVLLLMSINTVLSRVLPPIMVDAVVQPPPYSTFGPSAKHPHLDVHASESLCWSYTIFIVCAQLLAFGGVSARREEQKQRTMSTRKHGRLVTGCKENGRPKYQNSCVRTETGPVPNLSMAEQERYFSWARFDFYTRNLEASDESSRTSDSEIIL